MSTSLRAYGLVAVVSTVLAAAALRAGPGWTTGVAGDGDAWQNLWNVEHARRWIAEADPLYSTSMLWAPEGVGLGAHAFSPPFTIPSAFLSFVLGRPLAYNLTILGTFVLCALAGFRLARRLGLSSAAALVAALLITFSPPRFARAYGHLNLLGMGFLLMTLEGSLAVLLGDERSRKIGLPSIAIGTALTIYVDLYLTVLLGIALGSVAMLAKWIARDQVATRVAQTLIAVSLGVVLSLPALSAFRRDAPKTAGGHDSKWCSCAVTSLVIPGRLQVASVLTKPLTERNHQNNAEGPAYLGLAALIGAACMWRRARGALLAIAVAGGIALVLALGPQVRVFDTLLSVPLPYAALQKWLPLFDKGGCVTRFIQLAIVPLAVFFGLAFEQLWISRRGRIVAVVAVLVASFEYLPIRPPVEGWQIAPDAGLGVIERANEGIVADVDGGLWPLIRQLQHRRPLFTGYIARLPLQSLAAREKLVAWQYALGKGPAPGDAHSSIRELHRWGVRWLVGPNQQAFAERARTLGLPQVGQSDRCLVFTVDPPSGVVSLK